MRHSRVWSTQTAPPGGPRSKPRRAMLVRAGLGPGTVERESGKSRVARRLAHTTQVQRLLGAPHPSHLREGKETGRPRPTQVRDQPSVGFFCVWAV